MEQPTLVALVAKLLWCVQSYAVRYDQQLHLWFRHNTSIHQTHSQFSGTFFTEIFTTTQVSKLLEFILIWRRKL